MRFYATLLVLLWAVCGHAQLVKRIFTRTEPYTVGATTTIEQATVLTNGAFVVGGKEGNQNFVAFHSRSGSLLGKANITASVSFAFKGIRKLVPRSDGGLYVVGESIYSASWMAACVVCFDSNRNIVWTKDTTFEGTNWYEANVFDAVLGPNNSLFICGRGDQQFPARRAYAVMALTQAGSVLYNIASSYQDTPADVYAAGIAVDQNSNAEVAGVVGGGYAFTASISPSGAIGNTYFSPTPVGAFQSVCRLTNGQWVATGGEGQSKTVFLNESGTYRAYMSGLEFVYGGKKVHTVSDGALRCGPVPGGDVFFAKDVVSPSSIASNKWLRYFTVGQSSWEEYADSMIDAYDESYMLGSTSTSSNLVDAKYFLCKTNSAGAARWLEIWDPFPGAQAVPKAMVIHPASGDILVAGSKSGGANIALAIYRQSPIALSDLYVLPKNTVGYVSPRTVTNNDRFWQGSVSSLVSGPAHGTLDFRSNGTFTYTPNTNFVGNDTFVYRLTKALVGSTTAIVTMGVRQP